MPWFISVFLGGLIDIAGSLLGRVLLGLGLGFVEYQGINLLIDSAMSSAKSTIGGVSGSALAEWAGFFLIDKHISIVISAIGVKVLLHGLGGASVKRLASK